MTNTLKGHIIKTVSLGIDVLVPFIVTLTQVPIWVNRSAEATMSGLFILCAFLSCIPFFKQIKAYFKSPASWLMWCILLAVFTLLRNIIDEMVVVCFWGAIANGIGAGIYKFGDYVEKKDGNPTEKEKAE